MPEARYNGRMDRVKRAELELRIRQAVLARRERMTGRRQEPAAASRPPVPDDALDRLRRCLESLQGSLRDLERAMGEKSP